MSHMAQAFLDVFMLLIFEYTLWEKSDLFFPHRTATANICFTENDAVH